MKYIWTLPKKCCFPFKFCILKARPLVSVVLSSIVLMDTIDIRNPMFLFVLLNCRVTLRKSCRPAHSRVPIHTEFLYAQLELWRESMCRCLRKQLLGGTQALLKSDLETTQFLNLLCTLLWRSLASISFIPFLEVFTARVLQWYSKGSSKDPFTFLRSCFSWDARRILCQLTHIAVVSTPPAHTDTIPLVSKRYHMLLGQAAQGVNSCVGSRPVVRSGVYLHCPSLCYLLSMRFPLEWLRFT